MTREEQRRIRGFKMKMKYQPYVLETLHRDRDRCLDCGSTGYLIVHHIDESRKTGHLNNQLDNLVTLCKPCHARRHKQTSNREDVIEMREMGMTF